MWNEGVADWLFARLKTAPGASSRAPLMEPLAPELMVTCPVEELTRTMPVQLSVPPLISSAIDDVCVAVGLKY